MLRNLHARCEVLAGEMAAVVSALADINTQPSKKHDEAPHKTPIVQRIVNSDLETPSSSPTLRAGFNFVSPSVPPAHPSIPLNDDEAERRQRRLESRRKDFMSPGGHTPKNITSTADRCEFTYMCVVILSMCLCMYVRIMVIDSTSVYAYWINQTDDHHAAIAC